MNKLLSKSKKGAIGLETIQAWVIGLGVVALAAGAILISLESFKDTSASSATVNTTIDGAIGFFTELFSNFDTVGTIMFVGVILGIIGVAIYGYARTRGGGM